MSLLARAYVPSGEFRVSTAGPRVLHACLGTCVGVAVVDREARVGGLYHILLPDGVAAGLEQDTACAQSGMPLFLKALHEAGCSPARMSATVAGGALLGSVSRLDLVLDIGGRTVDLVNRTLAEAAIPVVRSETGGHFGSKLTLNLQTLTCGIEPVVERPTVPDQPPPRLTASELDRACARLRPIPQAALKIIRTVQTEDYSLAEIAREIRRDQVITARIIEVCNSAYVGARESITSIDHAVLLLGGRLVAQLILSSVMGPFFSGDPRGYSLSRGGLYHHAISTAIVSEHLARLTGVADPNLAYTAGLLHDIGKVLLDQYVACAHPLFYREVIAEGADLLETERALLGVSHEEAGARLATLWSFPPALHDVVAHHTDPRGAEHDQALTYLVYLANLLVLRFDAGHDLDRVGTENLADALARLGITGGDLPDLIRRIPWKALDTPGYA